MLGLRAVDLERLLWGNCSFCTSTQAPILVVDSDRDSLGLTVELLKLCGYWAIAATCSQTALQLFTESHPPLVLLELMLPEIDGFALTRYLRQQSSCPIITVTSLPRYLFQRDAFAAGCNEYIEKPIDLEQFTATVQHYLNTSFFLPWE